MLIAGFLDSLFFSDDRRVKAIFTHLPSLGYEQTPPSDPSLLQAIRQLKPIGGSLFVVKNAVSLKRPQGVRFICDLHTTMHINPGSSSIAGWTLIAQTQPVVIKAAVNITPRTAAYEILFKRAQHQEEVGLGLLPEFADLFYSFSKMKEEMWIPEPIQHVLLKASLSFPFKALQESVAIAHLSPLGWSLLCDRVKNAAWFNDLLKVSNQLEDAVGSTG
jgi:hypothetical protein